MKHITRSKKIVLLFLAYATSYPICLFAETAEQSNSVRPFLAGAACTGVAMVAIYCRRASVRIKRILTFPWERQQQEFQKVKAHLQAQRNDIHKTNASLSEQQKTLEAQRQTLNKILTRVGNIEENVGRIEIGVNDIKAQTDDMHKFLGTISRAIENNKGPIQSFLQSIRFNTLCSDKPSTLKLPAEKNS